MAEKWAEKWDGSNFYLNCKPQATEMIFEYKNLLKPFTSLCSRDFDFKRGRDAKFCVSTSAQRKDLKEGFSFGIKGFPPCALWFDCRIQDILYLINRTVPFISHIAQSRYEKHLSQ